MHSETIWNDLELQNHFWKQCLESMHSYGILDDLELQGINENNVYKECILYVPHVLARIYVHTMCRSLECSKLFVTRITCVFLSAWYGVLSFANVISRLKKIWGKINVFHTRQSTKNTFLLKIDNHIAVHEEPNHIVILVHTVPHHGSLYIKTCLLSVNRQSGVHNTK